MVGVTLPSFDMEDFVCPICMELAFKPVVNACGHVHCFWCVHKAMNPLQESNCPICRQVFHNFPRVCVLLHKFLKIAFQNEYSERSLQVQREEEQIGIFSPAIEGAILKPGVIKSNETPSNQETFSNSETLIEFDFKCHKCSQILENPLVLNCGHAICEKCKGKSLEYGEEKGENLGHFGLFPCPTCGEVQPKDNLKTCGILNSILKALFPEVSTANEIRENPLFSGDGKMSVPVNDEEKKIRANSKENLGDCAVQGLDPGTLPGGNEGENTGDSISGFRKTEEFLKEEDKGLNRVQLAWKMQSLISQRMEDALPEEFLFLLPEMIRVTKKYYVHTGVGCDGCGAYPIIGLRYRCNDCPEAIGYDLCDGCYNRQGSIPGRFNQNHKSDHKMENVSSSSIEALASEFVRATLSVESNGSLGSE